MFSLRVIWVVVLVSLLCTGITGGLLAKFTLAASTATINITATGSELDISLDNGTYDFGNKRLASKRGQGRNAVAGDFDGIPPALGNDALA